jgi:hypothetical protein
MKGIGRFTGMGVALLWVSSCGGDPIYASCKEPADCYVPDEVEAQCLDKYNAGFCTWSCGVDEDCAWADDEYPRVCASFESDPALYCFPACGSGDPEDPESCPQGFNCRSTGGGNDNRKVCFPNELTGSEPTGTTETPM